MSELHSQVETPEKFTNKKTKKTVKVFPLFGNYFIYLFFLHSKMLIWLKLAFDFTQHY